MCSAKTMQTRTIGGITGREAAAKWEAMYIEIHEGSGI